jgi:hypothetical protein
MPRSSKSALVSFMNAGSWEMGTLRARADSQLRCLMILIELF